MKKKILLGLGALALAVVTAPMFAAFEAHVINVTATIENALAVNTEPISFGTTFPEEVLYRTLNIGFSTSFASSTADGVNYVIRQKPKCGLPIEGTNPTQYSEYAQVTENTDGNFVCPERYVQLPLLCPFLSKTPDGVPVANDGSLDAFHGPLTDWNASTSAEYQVNGVLSKRVQDVVDDWTIDLHVPCFKGYCAQDKVIPLAYQEDYNLEHQQFGCDLWIEVTRVNRID